MKSLPLIAICGGGLLLGALAGRHAGSGAAGTTAEAKAAGERRAEEAREASFKRIVAAEGSDDPRIMRLFSAIGERAGIKRRALIHESLRDLAAADMPGLLARLEKLPPVRRGEPMLQLLERWLELDAPGAARWVHAHPPPGLAAEALARADPQGALEEAIRPPIDFNNLGLLSEAVTQLAGPDPAAKEAFFKTLPPSRMRDLAMQNLLEVWASHDPAAALAAAEDIPPGSIRRFTQQEVLKIWAQHDPASALAQVTDMLPSLTAGFNGNLLVSGTALAAAEKDPRMVLEWATGLPEEFGAVPAIAAASRWASEDPLTALDWCDANGIDVGRGAGVLNAALAAQPAAVAAWLENLPAGAERDRLEERALTLLVEGNGQRGAFNGSSPLAVQLMRDLPEEGQMRSALMMGAEWAGSASLAEVSAWAQDFPSGQTRANAITGAVAGAYRRDASQVDPFLATASADDRDAGLRGLALVMSWPDPAGAAERALTIGDSSLRHETLSQVLNDWRERNPGEMLAWLKGAASMPAAWKLELSSIGH